VIPVFQKMFVDMGGTLPAFTQLVINVSQACAPFGGLPGPFYRSLSGIPGFLQNEKGREKWIIISPAPDFRSLIKKVAIAKFTRTLSTMLSSGFQFWRDWTLWPAPQE